MKGVEGERVDVMNVESIMINYLIRSNHLGVEVVVAEKPIFNPH